MNTITIDNFGFFDPEFDAKALALAKRMLAKYGNCERGRNRLVFSSKFAVLKIPTCAEGCQDNDWEGSICGGIARSNKGTLSLFADDCYEFEAHEEVDYKLTVHQLSEPIFASM